MRLVTKRKRPLPLRQMVYITYSHLLQYTGINKTSTFATDVVLSGDGKAVVYDRSQTHLEMIRSDPTTYCSIPEGI